MKPLSDEEWSKFFDLLQRVVHSKGLTAAEKKEQFEIKVRDYGADLDAAEFAALISDE